MLGDGRQDVNCQPVRGRHITRNKIRTALHKIRNERNVARQAIETRDKESGTTLSTLC